MPAKPERSAAEKKAADSAREALVALERELPRTPLTQLHFSNDTEALVAILTKDKALPLMKKWNLPVSDETSAEWTAANAAELKELTRAIEDAEDNMGDSEVRDATLNRALFYLRIGDESAAIRELKATYELTVGAGSKLELRLTLVRAGMVFGDTAFVTKQLKEANEVAQGGDWDRRNRLKVYDALHMLANRRFADASPLLLEVLPTFGATELLDFDTFVRLAALAGLLTQERQPLRERVARAPELVKARLAGDATCRAVDALLNGQYRDYFVALVDMHDEHVKDALLAPHASYILRELRVRGYAQLLRSYRSVKMDAMAASFGVSVDFLDGELSRFIALGRLPCKIDKVGGVIEMQRPDVKADKYAQTLKQGDALLNRVQKLARIINI